MECAYAKHLYWDQPFQPKLVLVETVVVSNRTLFQPFLVETFSSKVSKMAEAQLVASVVLQELLEELVSPRCESDDELEFKATLSLET